MAAKAKKNLTVGELLEMYHVYNESVGKRPDTRKGYRSHLSQFEKWIGAESDASESIDELAIDRYRLHLVKRKLSPNSVNSYLRSLKAFLRWAARKKYIGEYPTVELLMIDPDGPKPALSNEEIDKLLAAAQEERAEHLKLRAKAAIMLMYSTGMRVSEVVSVEYESVKPLKVDGEEAHIVFLKGAKRGRPRPIVFAPAVWHAINEYRAEVKREFGISPTTLFVSEEGRILTKRGLQHLISRLKGRAGVTASAHTLRRSFASYWMNKSQGTEIEMLKKTGGWTDTKVIERHYGYYFDPTVVRAHRRNAPLWDNGEK